MASRLGRRAVANPRRLGGNYTAEQVERTRELLRPCLSLDQVIEQTDIIDTEEAALDIVLEREDFAQWWADVAKHLALLPGLGTRAVTVLEMRFGLDRDEPMTLDEIGRRFGVTRERIRQIEKKALETVREHVGAAA